VRRFPFFLLLFLGLFSSLLLSTPGDEENAYRVCSQVISYLILSLMNMPYHPLIGIQLFTLGDLSQNTHPELAVPFYEWALEVSFPFCFHFSG
jgi:hypothetical protein